MRQHELLQGGFKYVFGHKAQHAEQKNGRSAENRGGLSAAAERFTGP